MFAYLPIYDNGEEYENHQIDLGEKIYTQKNSAIDYIKSEGFTLEETFPSHLDTDIEEYKGVRYYKELIESASLKSVTGKMLDQREFMYVYEMPIEQD